MKNSFIRPSESMSQEARNALRVMVILLAVVPIILGYLIYQVVQTPSWQLWTVLGMVSAMPAIEIAALVLIRRGRHEAGIWLTFGAMFVMMILVSALVSGLGLILLVSGITLALLVAVPTLPPRQAGRFIVIGVAAGILTLLVDLFIPIERIPLAGFLTIIYIVLAILLPLFGYTVARQFRDYSLSAKLITAFLAVTIIPILGLAYYNNLTERQNLTNAATQALTTAAQEGASEVDGFIEEGLHDVSTYARLHSLHEYLLLSPAARAGSELEASVKEDLLTIASYDEVFITAVSLFDIHGNHVADTHPAEVGDDHGSETFFTQTVNLQAPFVSPVYIEDGIPTLSFSAPVNDEEGNLVGVLRMRYRAEVLQHLVAEHVGDFSGEEAFAVLLDENQIRLGDSEQPNLVLKSVAPLPAETLARLQTELRLPFGTIEELSTDFSSTHQALENIDTQPVFNAEFHEGENQVEHTVAVRLANQPWVFAFGQNEQVFLAPLQARTRTNAIVGVSIVVLVAAIGYFISQIISRPIVSLTAVAQQIADGNLTLQAEVPSRDEIGVLSKTFNTMAAQLKDTLDGLEQRVADRTKALAASAEVSRRLTMATDPRQLAVTVVEEVQSAFHYYHAHIYFMDETAGDLVMAGGTGEAGAAMLAHGHKIPKGRGLVGRAAETNAPVLVPDVTQAEGWLPNPLLPDTKSEVAVPIASRDQVLGVLDVQQNTVNGLGVEDVTLLQSLASQVAISLQNARTFRRIPRQG
ncbi:MAG: GAF domain-containing protein [Chloroflexi bacterium]|nr:GAF domain-containing protein [Chloroflexota bacterium]